MVNPWLTLLCCDREVRHDPSCRDVMTSSRHRDRQPCPLCFLDDPTYDRWMEVFDAWKQAKLIMEDGKKPDGIIPKILQRDITRHDVDRTIGLRNCNMIKLADAILAKKVSIKSNKLPSEQQCEGVSLQGC